MPLARYFSYVGGALLALLFILDAYLPKIAIEERAHANSPIIRIHSERKWPERIVFDTGVPAIIPAQIASAEFEPAGPEDDHGLLCQDEGARGLRADAVARYQAVATFQCKKAGSKAATQEQDRKEIHAAAFHVGAAMAIWLVWSDSLARRLTGAGCKALAKLRVPDQGAGILPNTYLAKSPGRDRGSASRSAEANQ